MKYGIAFDTMVPKQLIEQSTLKLSVSKLYSIQKKRTYQFFSKWACHHRCSVCSNRFSLLLCFWQVQATLLSWLHLSKRLLHATKAKRRCCDRAKQVRWSRVTRNRRTWYWRNNSAYASVTGPVNSRVQWVKHHLLWSGTIFQKFMTVPDVSGWLEAVYMYV